MNPKISHVPAPFSEVAPIIIQTPADGCNAARSILSHFQKSASLPQQEARDILVSQLWELINCLDRYDRDVCHGTDSTVSSLLGLCRSVMAPGTLQISPEILAVLPPDLQALVSTYTARTPRSKSPGIEAVSVSPEWNFHLKNIKANASAFDSVPDTLKIDPAFRRLAMEANTQIIRQWSFYKCAERQEIDWVFDQVVRSPGLIAGMPPEVRHQFLCERAASVRREHFQVLSDVVLSDLIVTLIALGQYDFWSDTPSSFRLTDVIGFMRPRALFANARQAAVTINNDKLFTKNADDPRRYLTIRNAIPPECWADIEYMRVFLGELDIPAESFPGDLIAPEIAGKPVIDRIGKVSYSSKFFPPEKASVFAKINTVSSAADLDPEVVSAVKRDPDMIRMFPLRLQMDPAIMARLVRECPQLVSEHLISSELLRDATILRAYYATAEAKTNHGVYFDYQHHSLETLRDLAEQYGIAVTADAGFLSVIEDRMSQSTPDAPAWKRFYQEIYSAEHGVVSEMVAIKAQYRASAPVSAGLDTGGPRSHDWLRRLLESPDRGRTLVLSDTQRRLLLDHAPQIQDMFAQLGTIEMGPEDIRRFLGVFGPDIRKNPKLAAALREAIVALGKSFVRDRESANNELHAKGMNSPARDQLREAARHLGIAVPEADDPRSIALLRAMIVERIKQNAHDQLAAALKKLKHADLPLIRRLFGQELEVVIAGITGLGANEREALRRDILSRFEADASLALMNSPVGDAAIMGVSDREFEAAVRQTETQIAAAYASGCFGDALVDRVASRSGVSLQITASQAGNQSNAGATARDLGLQAGADGRLIVDTPTASTPCYIDPDRWTISTPGGLEIKIDMTRGRNGIEQAVSSLEFLQRCGLQFLGADTERVLAIVRRIDPAVALHPEDGLDAEEQQFLLSNLLPFFGVEMSAGATLADMMTILDTMNHGTSERRSGLLSHLVETRVGYIDPDSLRFRIDRFETAFWAAR